MKLEDLAQILDVSHAQAYALVRSGEVPAIKIGGRGQWRIERAVFEEYVRDAYSRTAAFIEANPLGGPGDDQA